eukprot:g18852.t1
MRVAPNAKKSFSERVAVQVRRVPVSESTWEAMMVSFAPLAPPALRVILASLGKMDTSRLPLERDITVIDSILSTAEATASSSLDTREEEEEEEEEETEEDAG